MNTETRLTDRSDELNESKPLTEFKDGKYTLDFGYGRAETIFIETEGDKLLLITTQGVMEIDLNKLRIDNFTSEVKHDWYRIREVGE